MNIDKKERKDILRTSTKIEENNSLLEKSDWLVSKRKKEKIRAENEELKMKLNDYKEKHNDPNIVETIRQWIDEEFGTNALTEIGNRMQSTGENMQKFGRKTMKVGLKTTAITWTPLLYVGYKTGKLALEKDETPESQYVKLIKECEEAYQKGEIDEETLKYYIRDYANNHYRL